VSANIVLVHGAWADGSSWSAVVQRLQAAGYNVTAPQFPLTALANDVDRLREVLALQNGPTIVAGHSYGGQIMTALGKDAPNVCGLVYIAAPHPGRRCRPSRTSRSINKAWLGFRKTTT
jgi:pimeloyl-ACP methyl ester carboxylesterase